jgi:hypothetical protein
MSKNNKEETKVVLKVHSHGFIADGDWNYQQALEIIKNNNLNTIEDYEKMIEEAKNKPQGLILDGNLDVYIRYAIKELNK